MVNYRGGGGYTTQSKICQPTSLSPPPPPLNTSSVEWFRRTSCPHISREYDVLLQREVYLSDIYVWRMVNPRTDLVCLASPANFIYGRVEAKVLSHVTFMPVLLRSVKKNSGSSHRKCVRGEIQYCEQLFIRGSDLSKMPEFGDYPIFS